MPVELWTGRADLHGRLRWIGVGLFLVAAPVVVGGLAALATGRATAGILPWCLLSLGLSLGAFGTNDDTVLHALSELARKDAVPARHGAEWEKERKARPARISTLHTHPKAGWILPVAAIAAVAGAAWRVAGAWGLVA